MLLDAVKLQISWTWLGPPSARLIRRANLSQVYKKNMVLSSITPCKCICMDVSWKMKGFMINISPVGASKVSIYSYVQKIID